MIYGILYTLSAVVSVAAGIKLAGWGWLFLWLALNNLVMAAAYFGLSSRPFRKRPDGTIPCSTYLYLGPQLLLSDLVCRVRRSVVREASYDEIVPGLFVGGRPTSPKDIPEGVRTIVDLTAEFPARVWTRIGLQYVCLPVLDVSMPSLEDFRKIAHLVASHTDPIYVHCAVGHGRSVAVVVAALVLRGIDRTPEEAIQRVRSIRPGIRIQPVQLEAIRLACAEVEGVGHGTWDLGGS